MNDETKHNAFLFPLGQVVMTAGISEKYSSLELMPVLLLHATGNWGELDAHDKAENDAAVKNKVGRILSAYVLDGDRIWIITETDRSATTILYPSEY